MPEQLNNCGESDSIIFFGRNFGGKDMDGYELH
jgi:hypothetical protein